MSDADLDLDEDVDGNALPGATALTVLEHIVRSVVSEPDAVDVEVDDSSDKIRFNVRVGDDDMGRVIGRRGRIAQSIRTVVRAAAVRDDVRVEVEFLDD